MPSPRLHVPLCAAPLAALMLLSTGCSHFKKQMDDNADVRANVVRTSRDACVSKANEVTTEKTPEVSSRINSYCDCIATKGMGKFSNSELASIGLQGGHMNADQNKRLQEAVTMCQGDLSVR
jgi:hypothetical protein